MAEEFKRMIQRRGNLSQLPAISTEGELTIALDTKELFFGVDNDYVKVITENSFTDSLLNPKNNTPASTLQVAQLNLMITQLQDYVNQLNIEDKQEKIAVKSTTAPSDANLIWIDTN